LKDKIFEVFMDFDLSSKIKTSNNKITYICKKLERDDHRKFCPSKVSSYMVFLGKFISEISTWTCYSEKIFLTISIYHMAGSIDGK